MKTHGRTRNKRFGSAGRVRIMPFLLAFCLIMTSVMPASACRANSDAGGAGKQVFEVPGCRLEWSVGSRWETGYVAEVTVVNTGEKELRNWSVVAEMTGGSIRNSWNAGYKKTDTAEWSFEPEPHNRIIQPGERASFGFMTEGEACGEPVSLRLAQGSILSTENADVQWKETSSWDGHKIMEGTIINKSETPLNDWSLIFDMDGRITNIWNAVVTSGEDGRFCIRNCDYNAVIGAGQSAVFGFEISCDTESFGGIENTKVYACGGDSREATASPSVTAEPEKTKQPGKTAEPAATDAAQTPGVTITPDASAAPGATDSEEDEGGSDDDAVFIQVENRDWNMDMIHANDPEVVAAKRDARRAIRVTMLDSGINFSKEVDVAERKNFVEGEDEMTALFEDGSGHGTAIAEVLASNPKAEEEEPDIDFDEEFGQYTYYGDPEEDAGGEEEEDEDGLDTGEGEVTLADLLDSGYEWTEGVNPNIELYSGKVLDAQNETTVDRVVEGIEWAIEKNTDILSLSIGMDKDSPKLHRAIQKAASAGMLIIASVGDDEEVDYPAAYPEVMAVGMADSMGETDGIRSEVAAPGDFIVSRGVFDSMQVFSGSSMAVPHVAGLASILWQKDPSKKAEFIRGLIDVSANRAGDDSECQYGLIDCKYALECYGQFEQETEADPDILHRISRNKNPEAVKETLAGEIENDSRVETDEEIERLHANWKTDDHWQFVNNKYGPFKNKEFPRYVQMLFKGTTFVDSEKNNPSCFSMNKHPWFHGFFGGMEIKDGSGGRYPKSNYMTSYRTLAGLAVEMLDKGKIRKIDPEAESGGDRYIEVKNALAGIKEAFKDSKKVGDQTWEELCGGAGSVSKEDKSLLIYGMALHTLGDTFAHSSYRCKKKGEKMVWKRITHKKGGKYQADDPEICKFRHEAAQYAVKKALGYVVIKSEKLERYKTKAVKLNAFYEEEVFGELKGLLEPRKGKKVIPKGSYTENGFALGSFSECYAQEVAVTGKRCKKIDEYKRFVDRNEVGNYIKKYKKVKANVKQSMQELGEAVVYYLKSGGDILATLETVQSRISFFLNLNETYEVYGENLNGDTYKVCTIKGGKVYDEIGREMTKVEPPDEEDDEEDDDGEEVSELCDVDMYERSTDCLVKGKVVWFDSTVHSASREDMPGLEGVKVRFKSRDTGRVYETKTKENGAYQLQIPRGLYDASYEKDETFTTLRQFLQADMDLYENITVELIGKDWFGKGYLHGYVYDRATGKPLSGVQVQMIEGRSYFEDEPVQTMTTDEKGYFISRNQMAGEYTFVFRKPGYETIYRYATIVGRCEQFASRIEM